VHGFGFNVQCSKFKVQGLPTSNFVIRASNLHQPSANSKLLAGSKIVNCKLIIVYWDFPSVDLLIGYSLFFMVFVNLPSVDLLIGYSLFIMVFVNLPSVDFSAWRFSFRSESICYPQRVSNSCFSVQKFSRPP
jgi:hypothetical protein